MWLVAIIGVWLLLPLWLLLYTGGAIWFWRMSRRAKAESWDRERRSIFVTKLRYYIFAVNLIPLVFVILLLAVTVLHSLFAGG